MKGKRVQDDVDYNHFVQWDLSQPLRVNFEATHIKRDSGIDPSDYARRQLAMAPLGWTLDPFSAKSIVDVATSHAQAYRLGACKKFGDKADQSFCTALETAFPRDAMSGRFSPTKCFRVKRGSGCEISLRVG
jgi:hypothetical protein